MRWVTWTNIGVDRMACAWLIRRHIDPQAEFEFVPFGEQSLPAGAEPFDLPGVRLTHRGGHGSFHAFLSDYHLTDPVLQRLARIVDEADVVQEVTVEPIAPGLDFICRGLRLTSPDDQTAVARGLELYDAVYAQLAAEPAGRV